MLLSTPNLNIKSAALDPKRPVPHLSLPLWCFSWSVSEKHCLSKHTYHVCHRNHTYLYCASGTYNVSWVILTYTVSDQSYNSYHANLQLYVFSSITPSEEIAVILICWQNVLPYCGPGILSDCSSYSSGGSQASALCIVCCELLPCPLTQQWLQAHIHSQADGVRFPTIRLVLPLSPLSLCSNTPTLYHCQQLL